MSLPEIARGVNLHRRATVIAGSATDSKRKTGRSREGIHGYQKARQDYEDAGGERGRPEPMPEHGCGGPRWFLEKRKTERMERKIGGGELRGEARVSRAWWGIRRREKWFWWR
jgi:hypothetical protein